MNTYLKILLELLGFGILLVFVFGSLSGLKAHGLSFLGAGQLYTKRVLLIDSVRGEE